VWLRLRLRIGVVAICALAAGCASWSPPSTYPSSALPEIELPSRWTNADAAGGGARGVGADSLVVWWQRFDDPLMTDLIDQALAANTGVNAAQASLRQAQALRDVAAAGLAPTLGAGASAQRGMAGGNSTGSRLQAGLDGQWAPDIFGARRSGMEAADAVAAASSATLGDTQVQVAAEVALNVIALRSTQARWAIASANLANQQETLQITDWRQQAGLVTALEFEQARAAAAQTQSLLPALQTSLQQTAHALAVLSGKPPAALLGRLEPVPASGAASWAVPAAGADPLPDIPADILRQRADVRAAEYQVAAALAREEQAQAQRWPSFAIGGSIASSAVTAAALTHGASVVSSLIASVSLPLFDGGAARAQVRAQQAALEQAQQTYRAAVLGALRDVEDALAALSNDRLRLVDLRTAADAAGIAAGLARQRYSSGLVDFQTVLETQRNQLTTQDGVVSASADVGRDQVRLFTALGGGWRTDPAINNQRVGLQGAATR
jgi:NodT family efflux transporter outer membrane factor (OMF) lipoprotein